jgi:hypothetical protein
MKRELLIDSDWFSTLGMALLLVLSLSSVMRDVVKLLHGRTTQPVAIPTILLAVASIYLAAELRVSRIFRLAALLLGSGAAIRALAFYAHGSPESQRLAGINALIFSAAAFLLLSIGAIQWLYSVSQIKDRPASEPR